MINSTSSPNYLRIKFQFNAPTGVLPVMYIAVAKRQGADMCQLHGTIQNEIQNSAYAAQQEIKCKEQIVVGVNQFAVDEVLMLERLKVDPSIELGQQAKLKRLRKTCDRGRVTELLSQLKNLARETTNRIPHFIECVKNDITLGEICNTLRGVWGEYVAEGF